MLDPRLVRIAVIGALVAEQSAPPGAAPPASPDALPPPTQPLPRRTPIDWLID